MLLKMLSNRGTKKERNLKSLPVGSKEAVARKDHDSNAVPQAEGRRLLYESIAQGNALAEAEENARRKWRGK